MLYSTIEKIVIDGYKEIKVLSIDDLCIENIAHRMNIELHFTDKKTATTLFPDFTFINIHKYFPSYLKTWAFFHEIGHPVLHAVDQRMAVKTVSDFMEIQANRFALHASMPIHLVRYMDHITPYTLAHMFNVPLWAAERRMLQLESRYLLGQSF
ncbi:ImmA/IrrE family metallo-endopeptidase [Salicibibacter kimchii]|uniref:ImmA/IrrE family metallo-endopeptidase n=1 Tax=Salicibibacter kimchii TaxID=2099786 RepID=A0A345BUF4_9BACI|nr:ImmA/IrrE family metallo-endopeptidase [Salicibibacter kimchii]AXF54585.1 ImmA/IrrE family metallo-endopeptidase [Salicibibacter kimchii]